MTYNEWRDELKSNLLCVAENERRRVLEYYAEAYADRREAGFSEREIIADFGAPYDAAQRILNGDECDPYETDRRGYYRRTPQRPIERDEYFDDEPLDRRSPYSEKEKNKGEKGMKKTVKTSWVFVLLCIIFALPIGAIILAISAMMFVAIAAPVMVLLAGIAYTGLGVGLMFSNALMGLMGVGFGLMLLGAGIILISILPRIVKLVWTMFKKMGGFVKSLFTTEVE